MQWPMLLGNNLVVGVFSMRTDLLNRSGGLSRKTCNTRLSHSAPWKVVKKGGSPGLSDLQFGVSSCVKDAQAGKYSVSKGD